MFTGEKPDLTKRLLLLMRQKLKVAYENVLSQLLLNLLVMVNTLTWFHLKIYLTVFLKAIFSLLSVGSRDPVFVNP